DIGNGEGEIHLVRLVELLALRGRHALRGEAKRIVGIERGHGQRDDTPQNAQAGRRSCLQEDVRSVLRGGVDKEAAQRQLLRGAEGRRVKAIHKKFSSLSVQVACWRAIGSRQWPPDSAESIVPCTRFAVTAR